MSEHPDTAMLEQFTIGAMASPAKESFVAHVAACDACSEALAREARLELALGELRAHRRGSSSTHGRRGARPLAAVLLLAAAAALLFVIRRPPAGAPTSRPDHPSAGPITASAEPPDAVGAALAQLSVHVAPERAKIFFDDTPLPGNPAKLTIARDGRAHRIRAEAPGHRSRTELVVVDRVTVSVELILDRDVDDEVDPFGNELISLTIRSVPPTARLSLDGVPLPTNPAKGKYPRDGKRHVLEAAAPGFVSKTESITFDRPRAELVLTLERAPGAVRR